MSSTIVTGPSFTSSTSMRAPKTPVSTGTPCRAQRLAEPFVERLRNLRTRGGREARAVALRGVGEERELAHDQGGAADVDDGAVEAAIVVLEDPQARDLPGEPLRIGVGIALPHAEQDDEAGGYLAAHDTVHRHRGTRDALQNRFQPSRSLIRSA